MLEFSQKSYQRYFSPETGAPEKKIHPSKRRFGPAKKKSPPSANTRPSKPSSLNTSAKATSSLNTSAATTENKKKPYFFKKNKKNYKYHSKDASLSKKSTAIVNVPHIFADFFQTHPQLYCQYCSKAIEDLTSVIAPNDSGVFHFDCMIENLSKKNNINSSKEKIIYIGSGQFALVNTKKAGQHLRFTIEKVFDIENKNEPNALRETLKNIIVDTLKKGFSS